MEEFCLITPSFSLSSKDREKAMHNPSLSIGPSLNLSPVLKAEDLHTHSTKRELAEGIDLSFTDRGLTSRRREREREALRRCCYAQEKLPVLSPGPVLLKRETFCMRERESHEEEERPKMRPKPRLPAFSGLKVVVVMQKLASPFEDLLMKRPAAAAEVAE